MFSPLTYGFAFALVIIYLAEPLSGTTPGKALARLRVDCSRKRGLWARFAVKASGPILMCAALVLGAWPLVIVSCIAALAVLGATVLGRSIHDLAGGTTVVRL